MLDNVSVSPDCAPALSRLTATLKLTGLFVRAKLVLVVSAPAFEVADTGDADTLKPLRTVDTKDLSAELPTDADRIFEIDDSPRLPARSVTVSSKLRLVFACPAVCLSVCRYPMSRGSQSLFHRGHSKPLRSHCRHCCKWSTLPYR